jgi:8-oxo-dGTP pyrophosphatase MutT (NUDIX family)
MEAPSRQGRPPLPERSWRPCSRRDRAGGDKRGRQSRPRRRPARGRPTAAEATALVDSARTTGPTGARTRARRLPVHASSATAPRGDLCARGPTAAAAGRPSAGPGAARPGRRLERRGREAHRRRAGGSRTSRSGWWRAPGGSAGARAPRRGSTRVEGDRRGRGERVFNAGGEVLLIRYPRPPPAAPGPRALRGTSRSRRDRREAALREVLEEAGWPPRPGEARADTLRERAGGAAPQTTGSSAHRRPRPRWASRRSRRLFPPGGLGPLATPRGRLTPEPRSPREVQWLRRSRRPTSGALLGPLAPRGERAAVVALEASPTSPAGDHLSEKARAADGYLAPSTGRQPAAWPSLRGPARRACASTEGACTPWPMRPQQARPPVRRPDARGRRLSAPCVHALAGLASAQHGGSSQARASPGSGGGGGEALLVRPRAASSAGCCPTTRSGPLPAPLRPATPHSCHAVVGPGRARVTPLSRGAATR